jgi:hypothetical protein
LEKIGVTAAEITKGLDLRCRAMVGRFGRGRSFHAREKPRHDCRFARPASIFVLIKVAARGDGQEITARCAPSSNRIPSAPSDFD